MIPLRILIFSAFLFSVSCAYQWGSRDRALPGGYKQIAVPIFKNKSKEVGVETDFTNAMIQKIASSRVATVSDESVSPLVLHGEIAAITVTRGLGASRVENLPKDAILSAEYTINISTSVQLLRQSDQKVVWQGHFALQRVYLAPRIGTAVVNSANALYNQSQRQETIRVMADELMGEAHDRMTETF